MCCGVYCGVEEEPICAKCGKPCDESNAFKNLQGQWFHNACGAEHLSGTPDNRMTLKQLLIQIGLKCCVGIAVGYYLTEELLTGIAVGIVMGLVFHVITYLGIGYRSNYGSGIFGGGGFGGCGGSCFGGSCFGGSCGGGGCGGGGCGGGD